MNPIDSYPIVGSGRLGITFGYPQGFRASSHKRFLVGWLRDHVVATTRDIDDLASGLEAQCQTLRLEPPSESRARRLTRSAVHAYDEQFCALIHSHLPIVARERLDALLQASAVAPAVARSSGYVTTLAGPA